MSCPAMDVDVDVFKRNSNSNSLDSCLAPFPETSYPVFTDPPQPQPQKLRPIRRNSDDPSDIDVTPCLMNEEARCEMSYMTTVSKAFQEDAHILQLISHPPPQFTRCLPLPFLILLYYYYYYVNVDIVRGQNEGLNSWKFYYNFICITILNIGP